MPEALENTNLYKPIKLGNVELKNRLAMAPLTRFRNTEDFVATDSMLKYYEARAENNGGLIVTEATFCSFEFGLYKNGPMIKTDAQVEAWRQIVEAVHKKGTAIASQLWNLGRTADPALNKKHNVPFVAPSSIYMDEDSEKAAKAAGNEIHELTIAEIEDMKKEYVAAAKRAIEVAKFDFVEIHSAHGYLLDQFLQGNVNKRTDKYGGSIENRARFTLEVIDDLIEAVGAEHVAVRFSPYSKFQGSGGADAPVHPIAQFGYVLSELEKRAEKGNRLAYISIVEPRMYGIFVSEDPREFSTSWVQEIWKGPVVKSGAYFSDNDFEKLKHDVNANDQTLIGAGRFYISNPDLAARLKAGHALTKYDRSRFYNAFSNDGYLTWGKYGEEELSSESEVAKAVPKALA